MQRLAVPDAGAAGAAGRADVVHVDAFAFIDVVVVVADGVPAVDDGVGNPLEPDIQAAGREHFLVAARRRRRGQGRAVGAVRELVVFPGEVVEPLLHEARIGLGGKGGTVAAVFSIVKVALFSPGAKSCWKISSP